MKQKGKRTLTPKLRFPEFRDEPWWEEVPLEQIAERTTTKNLDGSIARVLTNSAERGILDQRDYFDKDIANAGNIDGYYIVDLGDYVYNPRISTLAPVGPISRNNIGKGVMSPLYTVFRFAEENTDFYQYYFKTVSWHMYLRRVSSMGARHDRMSITTCDFMAMPVPTPPAKEQQKIAECLSSLDGLIAAEGRKLVALRDHKRGLMQQLFPQPGETQPRLRFSNEGDWTAVGLPEAAFFQEGPGIMAVDFRTEGVPLVRLAGVGGSVVTLDGCNYLDPVKVAQKWSHFRLAVNDIIISTSATFGLSSLVTDAAAGAVFYTGLIRFRPSDERVDRGYLKIFLESPHFERQAKSAAVGGGIKHFGPTHLKQMQIPIPPLEEQRRIADCLSALDATITAQAAKTDALKTHKHGLMQQLFPSPEAS